MPLAFCYTDAVKRKLWTTNFTLVTAASAIGAIGGIAANFALSLLVFDETGSTFAAALTLAISLIPGLLIPLLAAPWMDRLPRKPVLVAGDIVNALLYAAAGIYLYLRSFSYTGYLAFSLLLSTIGSFDELAYSSIYPNLIPEGMEEKGYAVSGTLYPVLKVIITPVSALLYKSIGVPSLLLLASGLSLLAALTESRIRLIETNRLNGEHPSIKMWWNDVKAAAGYLKKEKGLMALFLYMGTTNGVAWGYSPLLVAFFSTAAGFTMEMYSFFTVAEFAGRTLGGTLHYNMKIPPKRKFGFAFIVYQLYEAMDMCLLWLPYPLMLVNRGICGFLGIQSATMRTAAVQRYIPEEMRARINAFQTMLITAFMAVLSLLVGALGELLPYAWCVTVCAGFSLLVCWCTVWAQRGSLRRVYVGDISKDGAGAE